MTNEHITALAREYAGQSIDPYGFSKSTYEEMVEEKAENVAYILHWLCDRFCLVDKGEAAKLCRLALEHGNSIDYGLIDDLTDFVLEVFPEQYHQVADTPDLGKEVEG